MNNEQLEQVINGVYPGIAHLVRDVDLDKSIVDKYNVGDIIYERAFVDTTLMIGKPIKKVRYSILSNHAVELNTLMEKEEDKNPWGLCLINRDAAFKVLDKYEYNNTTLITLLHIPLEYDKIFKQIKINLDDELIEKTRKRFEDSFNQESVPELDDSWYNRLTFPLGMSNEGVMFERPTGNDK